jgi:7,8-dihydropterin-6-yl-methyl-4-(beta-D-ribofuranosyl)aminobenzene 5'-phosphate synthase
VRAVCIVDNMVGGGSLWGEHGLAFLLEGEEGRRVLLDTGQSGKVLRHNMEELSIDPRQIEALVLSHGHQDHTGGLGVLLERVPGLGIHAHPDLFRPRFSRRDNGAVVSTGLPLSREAIEARAQLHLSALPTEVVPGVWTTGEITPRPEPEGRSRGHLIRNGNSWVPDPYRDDMSLILRTSGGLVLACGCCHAGLLNTLRHVCRTFDGDIIAVTGGTHLASADDDHLSRVVTALRDEFRSPVLYLNHCTGERARFRLTSAFGDRVRFCGAGAQSEF